MYKRQLLDVLGPIAPALSGGGADETLPVGGNGLSGATLGEPLTFGAMARAAIRAESAPASVTSGSFRLLQEPVVPSVLMEPPSATAELSVSLEAGLVPLSRRDARSEETSLVLPWVDADLSEMTSLLAGAGPRSGNLDPARAGASAPEEDSMPPPVLRLPLLPRLPFEPRCGGADGEGFSVQPQRCLLYTSPSPRD